LGDLQEVARDRSKNPCKSAYIPTQLQGVHLRGHPRSLASSVAVADAGRQLALVLAGDQPPFEASDLRVESADRGWMTQAGHVADPPDDDR
jgi:CTP:molybdopterin cytidylyltransferase MocA